MLDDTMIVYLDRLCGEANNELGERQERVEALLNSSLDELFTAEPRSLAHVIFMALVTYDRQAAAYEAAGEFDAALGVGFRKAALCALAREHGVDRELPHALERFGGGPLAHVKVAA
jgi:hypothetical protein